MSSLKDSAIVASSVVGGSGAGAGGVYAANSYLSSSLFSASASSYSGTSISMDSYQDKYKDPNNRKDLESGSCAQDTFAIDLSKYTTATSNADATPGQTDQNNVKGCLYIDIHKLEDKAVLAKLEMTLQKGDRGLIFGTVITNTTSTDKIASVSDPILRQNNWSIHVKRHNNGWKIKEGWRWGQPIGFTNDKPDKTIGLTLSGKAVDKAKNVSVTLQHPCYIDQCPKDGQMTEVLNKKYKWEQGSDDGEEMFQFVKIGLTGSYDSIVYWTGNKLKFESDDSAKEIDGSSGPVDSGRTKSECEQNQDGDDAETTGRIFYSHKWSDSGWVKKDSDKNFVLTECAFDLYVDKTNPPFKSTIQIHQI